MSTALPAWERLIAQGPFIERDTAEAVVFHDAMWLSNGYCPGGALERDLWRSADGVNWDRVCAQTPYDGYAEMAVYRDRIWAVKEGVWSSADGEHWEQIAATTPFGVRGYGELLVFQDQLWQLGSGRDVWRTTDGVTWDCVCPEAPYGSRSGAGVEVFGGKFWLLGGSTDEANDPPEAWYPNVTTHNDVWSSPDGCTWTRVLEHAPWAERKWCVSIVYAGWLWLVGGFSNRLRINYAEAWRTRDGVVWESYPMPVNFAPRHEVSLYDFRGSLYLVAGNAWPLLNDVWRLTLPPAV